MYNRQTIRRYILFQIPELILVILILFILQYFFEFPSWIIIAVVILSIIKDIVMFRFTWKSYVVHKKEDYARVKGKKCIAQQDFEKKGLVKLNGELWRVEVKKPVKKGESLVVTDIKGLLLIADKLS